MRITSDLWVSAVVRRAMSSGGFAALVRRGSTEAGAIFVMARDRMGRVTLYGPAPQSGYEEGRPSERLFVELLSQVEEAEASARLHKEMRFDSDLWVVEIEVDAEELARLVPLATS